MKQLEEIKKNKMIEWIAIIISIISLVVAYQSNSYTKKELKQKFINDLRNNIKDVKYKIINLDTLNEINKILFIEKLRDLLFYQCCTEEKKKYLTVTQNKKLDQLQEDIEDAFGFIVSDIEAEYHRDDIKNKLNVLIGKI